MNALVFIGLLLAIDTAPTNSYTTAATVYKTYNGASYQESTLNCKSGMLKFTKTVTFASAGFGITAYYANEIPFYTDNQGHTITKTQGRYNTFNDAANKSCFG